MRISRTIKLALRGLLANKVRTVLMMAGIVIGITTLTVIVSVSKGANAKVMKGIRNFGTNAVMVVAGGGKMIGPPDERVTTLSFDDAEAIRHEVKGISIIAPTAMKSEQTIVAGGQNTQAMVIGVTPEWEGAWEWSADTGEFISEEDNTSLAKICVLGQTTAKSLFGNSDPVGESVRIGSVTFKVKGVLVRKGTSPAGTDMDSRVIIPLSTAMRRLFNVTYLSQIRLYVGDVRDIERIAGEVTEILREKHHTAPPNTDDFRVVTPTAVAAMARKVAGTIGLFIGLVSLISLVVGGVVLANITLVSVSERKKEIGIRRAVGARKKDILLQFLIETVVLAIIGGAIGAVAGAFISKLLSLLTPLPAIISWEPFVVAFLVSAVVGVISGVQPARKAASLNPIEALR